MLAVIAQGVVGQPTPEHVQRDVATARTSTAAGPEPPSHEGTSRRRHSVADLRGPAEGAPDDRFELTARAADVQLSSGRIVHALTFDGMSPGPGAPRARRATWSRSSSRNEDVDVGVTIHWHGVDVPNAEDGVAGVTQNAVLPGESYTYRFRAEQVGTFWYHTHQVSSEEVQRGLFGALVIEPRAAPRGGLRPRRSSPTRSTGSRR